MFALIRLPNGTTEIHRKSDLRRRQRNKYFLNLNGTWVQVKILGINENKALLVSILTNMQIGIPYVQCSKVNLVNDETKTLLQLEDDPRADEKSVLNTDGIEINGHSGYSTESAGIPGLVSGAEVECQSNGQDIPRSCDINRPQNAVESTHDENNLTENVIATESSPLSNNHPRNNCLPDVSGAAVIAEVHRHEMEDTFPTNIRVCSEKNAMENDISLAIIPTPLDSLLSRSSHWGDNDTASPVVSGTEMISTIDAYEIPEILNISQLNALDDVETTDNNTDIMETIVSSESIPFPNEATTNNVSKNMDVSSRAMDSTETDKNLMLIVIQSESQLLPHSHPVDTITTLSTVSDAQVGNIDGGLIQSDDLQQTNSSLDAATFINADLPQNAEGINAVVSMNQRSADVLLTTRPSGLEDRSQQNIEIDSEDDSEFSGSDISELDALMAESFMPVLGQVNPPPEDLRDSENFDRNFNVSFLNDSDTLMSHLLKNPGDVNVSFPSLNATSTETSVLDATHDKDEDYNPDVDTAADISSDEADDSIQTDNQLNETNGFLSVDESIDCAVLSGAPDDQELRVFSSTERKSKKNFCYFCHTLQSVISRHLENRHGDEAAVKKFTCLPKGTAERRKAIEELRLRGNHLFNTSSTHNTGELLVSRQVRKNTKREAKDYKPCHKCFGWFASISRHRKVCLGEDKPYLKTNPIKSRLIAGRIHPSASFQLIKVFSVMHDDNVSRILRYDELIITFGNDLCAKYTKPQQHEMIRARLRLLGRLILRLRTINQTISTISQLFNPRRYNDFIHAVRLEAGFNEENNTCQKPETAATYGTYIKKLAIKYISECIKKEEYDTVKDVKYFLQVHEAEYSVLITKLAVETRTKNKRQKRVLLPTMSDITKFREYLIAEATALEGRLNERYDFDDWHLFAQVTLILVLLFNRKRPGELERIHVADYQVAARFSETNREMYDALTAEQKALADNYIRFDISGKLNRDVPVILSNEMQRNIRILLQYREQAGVLKKNPYIFALPGIDGSGRYRHLRACELMRSFGKICGAEYPERLRTTLLRKHIATTVASLKIDEFQIYDISNFMGHHEQIHRGIYRQPVIARDLCGVSKILEAAVGMNSTKPIPMDTESIRTVHDVNTDQNADNESTGLKDRASPLRLTLYKKSNGTGTNHQQWSQEPAVHNARKKGPFQRKRRRILNISESSSDEESEIDSSSDISRSAHKNFKPPIKKKAIDLNVKHPKRRWTEDELQAAFAAFQKNIDFQKLPTAKEIKQFLGSNRCISRTEPQIRTWVQNQINKSRK